KSKKPDQTTAPGFGDIAKHLWQRSIPAEGTPVEHYLRSRGYNCPIPSALRFFANGKHAESGLHLPMMVAGVMLHDGQNIVGVHRTFMAPSGTGKADVTPSKKSLGPVAGGAVWLSPQATTICVAEGIETALSCFQATGIACVAALSTGGMRKLLLPPLPLASEVIIAADNDPPGIEAARATAQRWHLDGRRVRIATPPTPGTDFNDLLRLGGIV
ncbi:MAG: toprim domain-containing protein, partial [Rhodospirillaceae bacterium]